jgi:hypothetical protein
MAPIMRPNDIEEVWAAGACDPLTGLKLSIASSLYAWSWFVDGVPVCVFGVGSLSLLGGEGVPWLLSSTLVERHWVPFLRHYKPFLRQMCDDFTCLANYVDARYALAIRWLRWMGFTVYPAEPYGPFGMAHHRFEMRTK